MAYCFWKCHWKYIGFLIIFITGMDNALASSPDHKVKYSGVTLVDEGYPFTISCIMSRRDRPRWTINGEEIDIDNESGYALSQEVTGTFGLLMTLKVEGAQLHHEGEYRCNGYSRDYHSLKIIRADEEEQYTSDTNYDGDDDDDDEDSDTKASNDQILKINDTISLFCTSAKDDDTPVHWYKNGRRIVPNANSNIEISRKYLFIDKAQDADAGEYMCTVDFAIQTGLTDIGRLFQIKSPAKIIDFPKKYSIIKGRSLTLQCKVQGFPPPRISWYLDNLNVSALVKSDSRIWIYAADSGQQNAFLTIRDMSFDDRGLYTCRAENFLNAGITPERDEETVFVHVRENMIETNEDEPGMGKLLVPGEELVLQCNTTECPQCRVVWFKDENPLADIDGHLKIYDDNNSVVIEKASYNDSGIYVCAIDREQLDVALNASIAVQSEIKLQKFESVSDVIVQGHPLELYCLAKGSPKPSIKWFKGNEEIDSTDERIKLLDHEGLTNGKLLIEEVDYEDRNHYTCEAYNQVNSVNITVFIRIKDRLAALWPFLGICAEVAILCSIIFVYEKRKSMSQYDEPDTDLPAENKNIKDQKRKGQDIRQRK